ncbi:DUF4359 domain-containing protein [Petrachloros mirabilis]
MSLVHLTLLVIVLSLCVGLVLGNPQMDHYLNFVEMELNKAIDRSDPSQPAREQQMLQAVFKAHSHELVQSFIPRYTVRKNFGFASLYETKIDDSSFLVLGVGGQFVPLKGKDEVILKLGRMAF